MTFENSPPLGLLPMELPSIVSSEDSPAKTFPSRAEQGQELTEREAAFGLSFSASLASYDLASSSWKTHQFSLSGGLTAFSEDFPRSGMMLSGTLYPLNPLVPSTFVKESGLLPTLTVMRVGENTSVKTFQARAARALERNGGRSGNGCGPDTAMALKMILPTLCARDYRGGATKERTAAMRLISRRGLDLPSWLRAMTDLTGGINPYWAEGFMGFPEGWTELEPSETP